MGRTLAVVLAGVVFAAANGRQPAPVPPDLTYEIRLIERPVGFERDRISGDAAGQRLESRFDIVDRGTAMKVESTFTVSPDLTPRAVEVRGKTYRFVNVDLSVLIENGRASVRSAGSNSVETMTGPFFVARGYAPLAARAWLVRYWETHGRPRELRALPGGANDGIRVELRGEDRVSSGGRTIRLRRYAVDGVVWGREAVWIDDENRLAAIATRIHILPMEAVRTDLRESFDALQASAVADRMRDVEDMRAGVTPIAQGAYALVGTRLVSGAAPPIEDATVVVGGGRITAAGPRAKVPVPEGMPVVQATGTTVIPGLWDMHAHASHIEWAPAYLAAGITTVRDMGGETRYLTAFRDALENGRGLGPRLLLAGLVDGAGDEGFGSTVAATPDEARAVVDRFRAAGFQQMKLYTLVAPDVVSAITSRAHAVGMTVTGHVPRALTAIQGVERGMDQIAHLPIRGDTGSAENRLLIATLATHHTVVDPTLSWTELLGRGPETSLESIEPAAGRLPKPLAENYRSIANASGTVMTRALEAVMAMHDGGVTIVVGTDGGVPGLSVLREIELFARAGLSPQRAIDAATRVPAQTMGMLGESGTIEVGKRADLLVLDGDPLADISNIRHGRWVAVGGRLYASRDIARLAGFDRDRAAVTAAAAR